MPKSTELREQANLLMQKAEREVDPSLRRSLTSQALALAQLAEEVEREEAHIRIIAEALANYRRHRQQLPESAPLEDESAARKILERLISAGYKIVSDAATKGR